MLGLQHSDMVLGKMDDMSPLFAQPTDQHIATGGGKRKPEEAGTLQQQGEQDATPHPTGRCVFLAFTFRLSSAETVVTIQHSFTHIAVITSCLFICT
jgi:hypothetical protein